jgi:hypothetical protein
MDKIESLDMRGLTLDERKDFLIWYESEFLNIKIKSEIENAIYRTKLFNEAEQNHPDVFSDEEDDEREPGYAQISGTLNDITDENLEKFISVIKEAKQSIMEI